MGCPRCHDPAQENKETKHNPFVPVNLPGQLMFRDMYFAAQAAIGAPFARVHGNRIVRFIDWHFQSKSPQPTEKDEDAMEDDEEAFPDRDYEIDFPEAEEWFQRWKTGRMGFP